MVQKYLNINKIKEKTNSLLKNDIYKNRNIECCPFCGGKNYIKHGSYKGIQRYKCKDCRKTFSNSTNLLWSYSKKDLNIWIKFVQLMVQKKSLRFCAKKLKISITTAFYWRHKILHGLKLDSVPSKLQGNVHINKTIVIENFKGCRKIPTTRRSNIWIVAAKGDEDTMLVAPTFRDFLNWKTFDEKIYSKIQKGSYIVAYNDRYIGVKAKAHNKKIVKDVKKDDRVGYIMANIMEWFAPYKGIATKYLEEYLSFYILFYLDKVFTYSDIISYLSLGSRFIRTKEIGV